MERTAPSDEAVNRDRGAGSTRRVEVTGAALRDLDRVSAFLRAELAPRGYPVPPSERITSLLESNESFLLLAVQREEIAGALALVELPWDSAELACSLARALFFAMRRKDGETSALRLLEAAREAGAARGWNAIWFRLPSGDVTALRAATRAGADYMGTLVTLRQEITGDDSQPASYGVTVRLASPADIPRLREIAARAFHLDRYHRDPLLDPGRVNGLWAASVENAVRGRASAVLVAETEDGVGGLITLHGGEGLDGERKDEVGVIGLVAVAEGAAGRGLGRALVERALDWFRDAGYRSVEVGTQGDQATALNLYAATGFRPRAVWVDCRLSLTIGY